MKLKSWIAALSLGLGLFLARPAAAQFEPPLQADFQEQQALADIEGRKYVHLRELAQKMLEDPERKERYTTYFFMGYVMHNAEGDLPRARWYLDRALEKYTQQHGSSARNAPWGWKYKMLTELAQVTGEMDEYAEQLKVWDRFDTLLADQFGRKVPMVQAFYSWPLMKLGREQEARERLKMALAGGNDENTVVQVLNSLGALEMETDHPQACYNAFMKLVQEVRSNGWTMTVVYLRNAGEAAACLLRFDEAEKLYLESTNYFDPRSFSNPWWDLATLYLGQGRFPEAVSSLQKCHDWTKNSEAFLAQQTWAANQQLSCEIMLQLGLTEQAYNLAKGFVDRPDRKGGDSVQRDQWQAANLIIFREAARARRYALQEEMVWARGWRWWHLLWEQRDLGWQAYLRGQQAASTIVSHNRLPSCLRYSYAPGTVLVPNYVRPELVTLLGPGTTLAALDELEARKFESLELERPYFDGLRFEALARSGRTRQALDLLEKVQTTLPQSEVLLRTRLQARAAQLYLRAGDMSKAIPTLQEVMQKAPGFLRTMQIALPVSFTSDGSPVAGQVISMCRRSPRFKEAAGAFQVEVTATGARLLGPDSSVLAQAEMGKAEKGMSAAALITRALHDRFFAAPIDLSQIDVGSLDGVVTGNSAQSKQVQEMFFPGSTSPDSEDAATPAPAQPAPEETF